MRIAVCLQGISRESDDMVKNLEKSRRAYLRNNGKNIVQNLIDLMHFSKDIVTEKKKGERFFRHAAGNPYPWLNDPAAFGGGS
jgi:hypothetical protein